MPASTAAADVTGLLLRRSWIRVRTSDRAALWSLPDGSAELYVPHSLRRDTLEWAGVLERIGAPYAETAVDVERSIEQTSYDVMRFRVNSTGETIPLESAATVINSAFGMIRAAATAARRPRQSIGRHYSKLGDDVARAARLGHTEMGSFVFPVLVHIQEPSPTEHATLPGVDSVIPESDERRVTRTLAQALTAFERQVVTPDVEPTSRSLLPMVFAGGTKELLAKVGEALAEPDISFLEMRFSWAGAAPVGEEIPSRVVIPTEARQHIQTAVRILADPQKDPLRVVVGPIIRIEHEPNDPFGEIVVQAPGPSSGRIGRVEVRVRAEQLEEIHGWMHAGTTVVLHGYVDSKPGHYAQFREIGTPQPLSNALPGLDT
ncbi:hypothetical protein [Microbacterium flavescens]|uniref:hypothetical protein n=1 Tax=Microbacterium flavescens TaxID=69366 RepID=UPI001BDEA290|nr:hypothetical protein [Microbacterium flavescens]